MNDETLRRRLSVAIEDVRHALVSGADADRWDALAHAVEAIGDDASFLALDDVQEVAAVLCGALRDTPGASDSSSLVAALMEADALVGAPVAGGDGGRDARGVILDDMTDRGTLLDIGETLRSAIRAGMQRGEEPTFIEVAGVGEAGERVLMHLERTVAVITHEIQARLGRVRVLALVDPSGDGRAIAAGLPRGCTVTMRPAAAEVLASEDTERSAWYEALPPFRAAVDPRAVERLLGLVGEIAKHVDAPSVVDEVRRTVIAATTTRVAAICNDLVPAFERAAEAHGAHAIISLETDAGEIAVHRAEAVRRTIARAVEHSLGFLVPRRAERLGRARIVINAAVEGPDVLIAVHTPDVGPNQAPEGAERTLLVALREELRAIGGHVTVRGNADGTVVEARAPAVGVGVRVLVPAGAHYCIPVATIDARRPARRFAVTSDGFGGRFVRRGGESIPLFACSATDGIVRFVAPGDRIDGEILFVRPAGCAAAIAVPGPVTETSAFLREDSRADLPDVSGSAVPVVSLLDLTARLADDGS